MGEKKKGLKYYNYAYSTPKVDDEQAKKFIDMFTAKENSTRNELDVKIIHGTKNTYYYAKFKGEYAPNLDLNMIKTEFGKFEKYTVDNGTKKDVKDFIPQMKKAEGIA